MVKSKPVIVHDAGCEEFWDDDLHGRVQWRTLFSNEHTPTDSFTAGVAEIRPKDRLKVHRHAPPELYYVIAGEGVLTIDDVQHPVRANSAVFIPGNSAHGIRSTGQSTLRFFYVFPVNSFGDVEYTFLG
jgi:mannose-6-phosphate isomerase-like protein (cupin superfamily)